MMLARRARLSAAPRKRSCVLSAFALALFAFLPGTRGSSWAAVIHVPGEFSTIQAALNAAAPGDQIEVAPGTYPEVTQFQGKAVTLLSSGGPAVTTIDGTGFNESVVRCISGEGPIPPGDRNRGRGGARAATRESRSLIASAPQ